jgi:kynurenine formamidase
VQATLEAQATQVAVGDILLIRTGWMQWYRSSPDTVRARLAAQGVHDMASPGLLPGRDMAEYLWDLHPAAIALDNPAVEQWPRGHPRPTEEVQQLVRDPDRCEEVFLHFSLLPLLGIPLGELWHLDDLAEACAGDRRYESMVASAPLHLAAGVGSPANAVAIR